MNHIGTIATVVNSWNSDSSAGSAGSGEAADFGRPATVFGAVVSAEWTDAVWFRMKLNRSPQDCACLGRWHGSPAFARLHLNYTGTAHLRPGLKVSGVHAGSDTPYLIGASNSVDTRVIGPVY